MNKNQQLDEHILNITQSHIILEQSELQQYLRERGHNIPQATLSRRLKRLNIAKVSGIYQVVNYDQHHLPLVLNIQVSHSGLIVLHTHPGNANSLGYFFDRHYVSYSCKGQNESLILGTIAGDDTVLLITKGKDSVQYVMEIIYSTFPYLTNANYKLEIKSKFEKKLKDF